MVDWEFVELNERIEATITVLTVAPVRHLVTLLIARGKISAGVFFGRRKKCI